MLKQEEEKNVILSKPSSTFGTTLERRTLGSQKSSIGISKSVTIDPKILTQLTSIGSSILNQRMELSSTRNISIEPPLLEEDDIVSWTSRNKDNKFHKKKGRHVDLRRIKMLFNRHRM